MTSCLNEYLMQKLIRTSFVNEGQNFQNTEKMLLKMKIFTAFAFIQLGDTKLKTGLCG